jgi:dipeptidyl aminopeptidase/acylaminoacyl peptidase
MSQLKSIATLLAFAIPALAQPTPRVYTASDYAQAEKFMSYNVNSLVLHAVADPSWMPDGRMWYRDAGANGYTYYLVDPVKATKTRAFDQAKLANGLKTLTGGQVDIDANELPISSFTLTNNDQTVVTTISGRRISCDLSGAGVCVADDSTPQGGRRRRGGRGGGVDTSPDGTKAAFIRDWNLWIRNTKTGDETQLTTDGVKDYGYATDNAGWTHSDNPILVWSPDSKRIATFQQDQRKTGELYLTNVTNGHPTLTTLKYPLVGDKDVTMIERVVINLDPTPKVVRLKMPPDQHRSTLCDDVSCRGGSGWDDVQFSADSNTLAFVSTSRDHKQEWMRLANPNTGDVKEVMGETVAKFFESGNDKVNWHYLSASNELLWFSERDNWGHLYLYDINTGKLKNQITRGDWNVTQVLGIDEKARTLFFLGVGREPGVDPYFPMYYRVNFDGKGLQLLTPDKADHVITPSPDNKYFVDVYSTAIEPEVAVLRDATGKLLVPIAHEDITRLKATGWQPPVQIMVKGRDNQTDLYGFMFTPTGFDDSGKTKYPIVNHVYPGPQTGSCGARTFAAAHGDMQSLAELGFIVVCIDGMGTPGRSKSFHEAYYGDMGDATIPDQVTGMKQLAARYPWIDISKAGMYGHSGGGNATAGAMFHFPDFFKAGIAESGNHDNRDYEDDWAEKWTGLLVKNADGTSNYDSQANQATAKNLKGHLMLAHGTMDDNVPAANTLLVVDALIKANKDFDLIMFPNAHHGYGEAAEYMTRRRWDYFVRYLAGATPPHEYAMKDYASVLSAMNGSGPTDVDWDTITDPIDQPQP